MGNSTVRCNNGSFIGEDLDNIQIWRGIPYAKQPVGERRWKRPEPADDDNGTYEAIKPAHIPIVPVSILYEEILNDTIVMDEDCLTLNIFKAKASDSEKRPVMVWIHGGGFMIETISDPMYDLTNIALEQPDILFVTIEYRMGIMGFMNFEKVPGGENFPDAGVLGLLDQLEALRWIKKNIAAFGGDPDNITIFGESAGSASACFLPLMEGSEGLFNRIIGQSANVTCSDTKEHGVIVTENLLLHAHRETMDELMLLSKDQLWEILLKMIGTNKKEYLGGGNFPILDGVNLPEDRAVLYDMWGDEKRSKIDMILGSNKDEIKYFMAENGGPEPFTETLKWTAKKDRSMLSDEEKAMMDKFMETLEGEDDLERFQQYANDLGFRAGNTLMAINHAKAGGNTYMYYIRKPELTPEVGVMHATELCYLFDHPYAGTEVDREDAGLEECEFRHVIKEMWTNFARCGDPSTEKYEWKQFSEEDRQTLVFDDTIGMQKDILDRREDYMMSWSKRLGNGGGKMLC